LQQDRLAAFLQNIVRHILHAEFHFQTQKVGYLQKYAALFSMH